MKAVYLIQPWFLILLPPFNPTMVFSFLLLILLPTLMESRSLREDGDVFLGTFLRARDNQNIINLTRSTQTDISQPSFLQRSGNLEPSSNQRSGSLEPSSNQRSGNLEPSSNQRSGSPDYFFKKVQEILNQGSAKNPETGRASSETSFSSEDKFSSSSFFPSEERKYWGLIFLFCTSFKYLKSVEKSRKIPLFYHMKTELNFFSYFL